MATKTPAKKTKTAKVEDKAEATEEIVAVEEKTSKKESTKAPKVAKVAKKTDSKKASDTNKVKRIPRKQAEKTVRALVTKPFYSVDEAAELLSKISLSKFVGGADLTVNLSLKDKQANESIRGSITYPNRFGAEARVVVLTSPDKQIEAKKAGADHVGLDDLVEKISGGWIDFDVVIASPDAMVKIARLGKVLGPRQLMPNPRTGTVTDKIEAAVTQYKSGKTDFKMDAGKSIKLSFGKLDMEPSKLAENLQTAIDAIHSETRRLGLNAIKSIVVKPTMGPVLKIKQ